MSYSSASDPATHGGGATCRRGFALTLHAAARRSTELRGRRPGFYLIRPQLMLGVYPAVSRSMNTDILTARLRLVLGNREEALASVEGMSPSDRAEVSPLWLARVRSSTSPDPWVHGFTIVSRAPEVIIGMCGYKGPPDSDDSIEIAYGINPPYQGQGYATEAARALSTFAFDSGQVKVVRAHTKPENNASTRVLTKCGFECVGEVVDPEDGLVWRWELQPPSEALTPTATP
jgi:ribosomal-protein-alanine N-acetyltransferase